jgi:hypothetical protein
MGIGDSIGAGVQAKKQLQATKKEQRRIEDERERAMWMTDQMDYAPERVSDHIGPYQRAEAPVADAFLNSFLSGDNPDAIQSTRAGAPAQKAAAQQRFDQNTGGWDALRQRQQALQASTPWAIKPFTREISKPDVGKEQYISQSTGYVSPEEAEALGRAGFKFREGNLLTKSSGKDAAKIIKRLGVNDQTPEGQQLLRGIARQIQAGSTHKDILAGIAARQKQSATTDPRYRGSDPNMAMERAGKASDPARQEFIRRLIEQGA